MRLTLVLATTTALLCSSARADTLNTDMSDFPKWQRVMDNEEVQQPQRFDGPIAVLLSNTQKHYMRVSYVEDMDNYGVVDYWATRAEMDAKGSGDCEDFASAEYFDLYEVGVSEADMFIVVVLVKKTQEIHAYLQVGNAVLDRRAPRVLTVDEAAQYYTPIFHISRLGWKAN